MPEKQLLLVCEGETDVYVFQAIAGHFSTSENRWAITSLAPQQDATSGTYPAHGYGEVLNWCSANKNKLQMLIDFRGAVALLVQMDTDIAGKIDPTCVRQGETARLCCQNQLNQRFGTDSEPDRCYYILPSQNTETWLLACQNHSVLDHDMKPIANYESIIDSDQRLIEFGFPSKKGVNKQAPRKLNKTPAEKYKKYAKQLTENLGVARLRCAELNRLSDLFEHPIN